MKKLLFLILLFSFFLSQAQNPDIKRTWHWYFGLGAGLDFSGATLSNDTINSMNGIEACAILSDTSGNLLFYSNGDTVWDRTHAIMPNGTGLFGCGSSTSGVLIVPDPGHSNLYFIFTTDCAEDSGKLGLRYSIVDLNQNGGNGDLILKNKLLFAPSAEKLCAVYNCDSSGFWIVSHEAWTNNYRAYSLTQAGLDSLPVISSTGTSGFGMPPYYALVGNQKISPDGERIAYALIPFPNSILELSNFNRNTGVIYNTISLPPDTSNYGIEFSQDNSKLYVSGGYHLNCIHQFDLSSGNAMTIVNSKTLIGSDPFNYMLDLQLGSDGRIYVAHYYKDTIGAIKFPNITGLSCSYIDKYFSLDSKVCHETFPDFVNSFFRISQSTCADGVQDLSLNNVMVNYSMGSDKIIISSGDEMSCAIGIYDINGAMEFFSEASISMREVVIVDVGHLSNGIYLLTVQSDNFYLTKKIIKIN